MKTDENMD